MKQINDRGQFITLFIELNGQQREEKNINEINYP